MTIIVQKFGGTSVGDIERIEQVADKVAAFNADGHDLAGRTIADFVLDGAAE